MRIGIPKEIKVLEGRVGLIPAAAAELVKAGHEVFVESTAGVLSGYSDAEYEAVGIKVLPNAAELYGQSEMIIKVKEPQKGDLALLRKDHLLFCYLHLAAEPELTRELLNIGLTGVAFETVTVDGRLPLLAPMSIIAGKIGAQAGCHILHQPLGGRGILLGGLGGTSRGRVVVIGAGAAGSNSARVAAGLGADVTIFDLSVQRLEAMRDLGPNVTTLYPYQEDIRQAVTDADLVIGAVLIPGAAAPHVVTEEMVRSMRPGSVIVDISVDQGGCIETTRPTNYENPTYVHEGVVHFAVTNMPGAVPYTASQALSAAITPYALRLAAEADWEKSSDLAAGINVKDGKLILDTMEV